MNKLAVLQDLDPNRVETPPNLLPDTLKQPTVGTKVNNQGDGFYQSPQFKGWRGQQVSNSKPQDNLHQLEQLLSNQESVLNSCNASALPDGGQRLMNRIKDLKLEIAAKNIELSNTQAACTNSLASTKSMPKPGDSRAKTTGNGSRVISWAGPPSSQYLPGADGELAIKDHGRSATATEWAKPPSSELTYGAPNARSSSQPQAKTSALNAFAAPFVPSSVSDATVHRQDSSYQNPRALNNFHSQGISQNHERFTSQNQNVHRHNFMKPTNTYSKFEPHRYAGTTQHFNNYVQKHNAAKPFTNAANPSQKDSYANGNAIPKFLNLWSAKSQYQQYYGGRMTKTRIEEVKTVTQNAVVTLHKSLEGCPDAETETTDPPGLKSSLMIHQRQALAWLLWREKQEPPGGILADDMGLGKTLTFLTLVLKQRHLKEGAKPVKENQWLDKKGLLKSNGTLVVCPASLLMQWEKEVKVHCQEDALSVLLYHGPNREKDVVKLSSYDIVITTYAIITKELGDAKDVKENEDLSNTSPLQRIAWERVVLDEAHTIKNPKSKGCNAVSHLRATYRWAVTGTPIHNNLLDMYALLRFLRVSPFDELKVWKKWVDNKTPQGTERLNTLIKSLLLRRTKEQLDSSGKPLVRLPTKSTITHEITLSEKERTVYDHVYKYFKSTLANVLSMREAAQSGAKKDTFKGSQALLFTLLLRLQQACDHLSLLNQAVEDSIERDAEDLASELDSLSLDQKSSNQNEETLSLDQKSSNKKEETLSLDQKLPLPKLEEETFSLSSYKDDPHFAPAFQSTKVSALMEKIKKICQGPEKEKCVVVSQWTSMLKVVAFHLTEMEIDYSLIQGNIHLKDRMVALENFNSQPDKAQVMLLSLKAGGVGLNLTGGNHLFLMDVHWNPALESQASDRVFRVGQTKDVTIHRFICQNSVEEQILSLQKKKLALANSVLEGGNKCSTGLTLDDLKQLFCVK